MLRSLTASLLRRPKLLTALFLLAALTLIAHYKLAVTATSTAFATSQGPRQSSPVALASDDHTLVNVNPEANTGNRATHPCCDGERAQLCLRRRYTFSEKEIHHEDTKSTKEDQAAQVILLFSLP